MEMDAERERRHRAEIQAAAADAKLQEMHAPLARQGSAAPTLGIPSEFQSKKSVAWTWLVAFRFDFIALVWYEW